MRFSPLTQRLDGLGGAKWAVHAKARAMKAAGEAVIELTIGEPDAPPPPDLIQSVIEGLEAQRLGYSNGQGEPALLRAVAARYSAASGRAIGPANVMAFPGTQTVLFAILQCLVAPGDEVLMGDPMYATYEGLIAATGADLVRVPLRVEAGFRMQAQDVAARITPRSRLLFLNSPHNPTGAILSRQDFAALGALAKAHDLWILCDEVYEEMAFDGQEHVTALALSEFADRVIIASSISKSHAAPGLRSGWCVGPAEFVARALPLSETMLFGNQPFIADATARALSAPSPIARQMAARFQSRAERLHAALDGVAGLRVHRPQGGMFALVDVRALGCSGTDFALALLERHHVAVMPGESFGQGLAGWLRLSLTQPEGLIDKAAERIALLARQMGGIA